MERKLLFPVSGIGLSLLVISFAITPITDYDFWWHLNLGKSILSAGSFAIPDSFSYTYAGKPQFMGEWLGDLLLYLSYDFGGLIGVIVLKSFLLALTFSLLLAALREENFEKFPVSWLPASLITLIVVLFAIRFRLYIRPYLFSYLFVAAFLFILSRYARTGRRALLVMLPLIEIIWANTSKGAFFGPVIVTLFILSTLVRRRIDPALLAAFCTTALVAMLNPETYGIYSIVTDYARADPTITVGEQRPLSAQMLWGQGWRYTLPYQILVAGSLAYFIGFGGWRNLFHLLLFALFFGASLKMVRMIDFFSISSALFFVKPIAALLGRLPKRLLERQTTAGFVAVAVMAGIGAVAIIGNQTYPWGIGVKQAHVPEGAVAFLDRERVGGRLFNSYPFGGYIAWRAPERQVFIDGRGGHLYAPEFHEEYVKALHTAADWQRIEDRWGFDSAILEYEQESRGLHFPKHIARNPDWALVYWDDHSAVYLKRTPANQFVVDRYAYAVTRPNFYQFDYLDAFIRSGGAERLLAGIEHDMALNPDNQEPRLAKTYVLFNIGGARNKEEALWELRKCLNLKPDLAMEHSALALLLLERGERAAATVEVKAALRIDPADPAANELKKKLGL